MMLERGQLLLSDMVQGWRRPREERAANQSGASLGGDMMDMRTTRSRRPGGFSAHTLELRPGMSHNVQVYHLFLFSNPDLLRASRLTTVMQRQGAIFDESSGSGSTYELSSPVHRIDAFLSHNWSLPRYHKFACLAIHYYFKTSALITALVMLGALWVGKSLELDKKALTQAVIALYIPLELLVLFCIQDFLHFAAVVFPRLLGPTIFLDKTCIHQEDRVIQRQGIKKLGAFLNASQTMVVIYSRVYLQKLWTIYEMASWITIKPLKDMRIVPSFLPTITVVCLVVPWLVTNLSVFFLLENLDMDDKVWFFMLRQMMTAQAMWWPTRKFALSESKLCEHIKSFDVTKSVCACESDRPLVYRNISDILKTIQAVSEVASLDDALGAFNDLVRKNLPNAVKESMGDHLGLTYVHMLTFVLLPELPFFVLPKFDSNRAWAAFIREVTNAFMVMPVLFAIVMRVCNSALQLEGIISIIYIEVCIFSSFGLIYATELYFTGPKTPQPAFAITFCILMSMVTLYIFNPGARCPWEWFCHGKLKPPVQLDIMRPSTPCSTSTFGIIRGAVSREGSDMSLGTSRTWSDLDQSADPSFPLQLQVPRFSESTQTTLREVFGAYSNPVRDDFREQHSVHCSDDFHEQPSVSSSQGSEMVDRLSSSFLM